MAGTNTLFCFRHAPHIARELRALPSTSPDRRVLEEQIERMSQDALVAADAVFSALWWTIADQAGPNPVHRHRSRIDKSSATSLTASGARVRSEES